MQRGEGDQRRSTLLFYLLRPRQRWENILVLEGFADITLLSVRPFIPSLLASLHLTQFSLVRSLSVMVGTKHYA